MDWVEISEYLENRLRLRTFPLGLKFLDKKEELASFKVKKLANPVMFCQLVTVARTYGWTVGATGEDFEGVSVVCPSILGFIPKPARLEDGTFRSLVWFENQEDAKKCEDGIPTLPYGKFQAVVLAPLRQAKFEPDMILLYGTPAQMSLLVNAIQWKDYERLQFYSVGESACSDSVVQCYQSGKPALTVPCFGERSYGQVAEDELVMALPNAYGAKVVDGLEGLGRHGIRYPIVQSGVQINPTANMPKSYLDLFKDE